MEPSIEEQIKALPANPGCYIYRDSNKKVIYVGKAKNLKKRVSQYFAKSVDHSTRIEQMITRIHSLEIHIVDTELEALVLEANLIKKYRPKYNVMMKDDKTYTWIKITTKEPYPRVMRIRDTDKRDDGNTYFGPYPDSRTVFNILRVLRKSFPFRTCTYEISESDMQHKSRLCLYYYIGLCPGPCDHLIAKAVYRKQIQEVIRFLRGDNKQMISEYQKQMLMYAKQEEYEKAAILRDRVNDMFYITQKISLDTSVDEEVFEKERGKKLLAGLYELFEKVQAKGEHNWRMECYDISNIQGTNPVGAMTVFENGLAKKSDYRKFKIRSLQSPNDFAMMREMLERRFTHLLDETTDASFKSIPDLIIIDGGKGQLSTAYSVLEEKGLKIPIVGLAKREELLFFPNTDEPLKLKRGSMALFLVQRIRDEAHRFGITFHRSLRSKQALKSPIDSIPGIGSKTKATLIGKYRTIERILAASDADLHTLVSQKAISALREYQQKISQ